MGNRVVSFYVVLRRKPKWKGRASVVRHSVGRPTLERGQCAVRVEIAVPDEAFDPVLAGPSLAFAVENTLRAEVTEEDP